MTPIQIFTLLVVGFWFGILEYHLSNKNEAAPIVFFLGLAAFITTLVVVANFLIVGFQAIF